MRIIVISDTHIPKKAKKLPDILIQDLKGADMVLHAGDFQIMDVYEELAGYGKLIGVAGNVDSPELHDLLGEKHLLMLNGFSIGLTHGHGEKLTTEKRAIQAFQDEKPDCIIFGHSHIPVLKTEKDILLFNPGSPLDKRKQPRYSYGILTLGDELHAEHVFFDDRG
ncbi:metallophosphoesterase [Metabacillus sp. GX 13764]|uniref:metallophosphoesterase family protein n=1 Tax=Metabacillus kandeliae TaxID=2900151 RepID=UPI001E3DC236|nr:metallophosphoesterase [Metabacillus kandeliae]MCD7035608.1 metallophosphoesterase [Metabacillus kandeliae]